MHRIDGFLDYQTCLEAAGLTVHTIEHFGSYQGDWWAHVTLPDGRKGFVHGYYGSCSGCDALEGAFGYGFGNYEGGHTTFTDEEWAAVADFGKSEAEEFYPTLEAAIKEAGRYSEWDMTAKEVVAWLAALRTEEATKNREET